MRGPFRFPIHCFGSALKLVHVRGEEGERMELLNALVSFAAVLAAVVGVIRFVHARTGVAVSWLLGAGLVVVVSALLFKAGLESVATVISLGSAAIGSFRFYRERSIRGRVLIAVLIGVILLAIAWVVSLAFVIFNAVVLLIIQAIIDALFKSVTPSGH
jgi:hypothetical protein